MKKKLLLRDVTIRDGQQSMFATRMTQAQVDKIIHLYREAGFYAMEVWGGAVPDSIMRYLNEDPWKRLEKIKSAIGDTSLLTALSRGRNLFGYNPYPEEVIEGFNRNAIRSGIDIMRIFDALNDINNIVSSIRYVKENGGMADCTVCYTIDPKFSTRDKLKAAFQLKRLPSNIFTTEYFVELAKKMEAHGADMITIKDMAGLIPPSEAGELIREFKKALKIPVDFHTHCTPGYGVASSLMAIINGVDILDTALKEFAGGPAAPSYEIIQIFADKLGIDTGVNREVAFKINELLKQIRIELKEYDGYKDLPREFNISSYTLPAEIDSLFDKAIEMAQKDKEEELLEACQKIEAWFNYPPPNVMVQKAEIPGGMYTNMMAQLKQLKLDHLLERTLELVPMVRLKAGCPPLVTPTSQIIGVQAVNCAIDESKKQEFYTTKSIQFVNLVKGFYGKTPIPIEPEFRELICGHKEEIPYDTSAYQRQANPVLEEFGAIKLAEDEKDELLLELFPSVANNFLYNKHQEQHRAEMQRIVEEERSRIEHEKAEYDNLSPEEKEKRLIEGLYNYQWTSYDDEGLMGLS